MPPSSSSSSSPSSPSPSGIAAAAPEPTSPHRLPCIEQPLRCYLSSLSHDKRLTCTNSAGVGSIGGGSNQCTPVLPTSRRSDSEQFYLLPGADELFLIQSVKTGRYLSCDGVNGTVTAKRLSERDGEVPGDEERWCLIRAPRFDDSGDHYGSVAGAGDQGGGGGGGGCRFFLRSVEHNVNVSVNDDADHTYYGSNTPSKLRIGTANLKLPSEVFTVEFVTGELLFLNAPHIDKRVRCDLAGNVTLTENWKGWEVWRFVECGSGGRFRINSWMHSQYHLISDPEGRVSASTYSYPKSTSSGSRTHHEHHGGHGHGEAGWDEWIMEKALPSEGYGVLIKSVAHGRLLCFGNDHLYTWGLLDENGRARLTGGGGGGGSSPTNNASASSVGHASASSRLWHLEAAHSQSYVLSSSYYGPPGSNSSSSCTRTLGPYPHVTDGTKKKTAEGIRIDIMPEESVVDDGDDDPGSGSGGGGKQTTTVVALYVQSQHQYLGSTEHGAVYLYPTCAGKSELWHMEMTVDGSGCVFRSKAWGRVLTYCRNVEEGSGVGVGGGIMLGKRKEQRWRLRTATAKEVEADNNNDDGDDNDDDGGEEERQLQRPSRREVWRLDPILPRAVSSARIKTFAIGTSIAVGTTIAMPFAMAGFAGVIGTEAGILLRVVAASLTGAEALASVGAIGATAYLCFREMGDSLSISSHDVAEEKSCEAAYTKRPFCAWRSWSTQPEPVHIL